MKHFNIITIFPHIFESYFGESIIKRALQKKFININIINLRDFTNDKHKTVDDTPYGGGAGMILKIQPIFDCIEFLKLKIKSEKLKVRTVLFSAKGKKYTQKDAIRLSKYDNLILICGRYEGVDERVAKYIADEEISIGDYVLSGGEIPAMVLVDSIARLIPGVLGNPDSLKEESFNKIQNTKYKIPDTILEYPQYTRPENFKGWKVPEVLLSGNHKKIEKWRENNAKIK
ncbi:MAG: tRNA (guanosine(37)-N1)-methyltransferase TrmD [Patescibacteria group bacterium]